MAKPDPGQSRSRAERNFRIAEIDAELEPIRERLHSLSAERAALVQANNREDWPDGPFKLYYWRYHAEYDNEYDTPLEALRAARAMEDAGEASTVRITDCHGNEIYDLSSYPPTRENDAYPEVPDDL